MWITLWITCGYSVEKSNFIVDKTKNDIIIVLFQPDINMNFQLYA